MSGTMKNKKNFHWLITEICKKNTSSVDFVLGTVLSISYVTVSFNPQTTTGMVLL